MSAVYPPMRLNAVCSCCGESQWLFDINEGKMPRAVEIKEQVQIVLKPVMRKRDEKESTGWIIGNRGWYCSVGCRVIQEPNYWERKREGNSDSHD